MGAETDGYSFITDVIPLFTWQLTITINLSEMNLTFGCTVSGSTT